MAIDSTQFVIIGENIHCTRKVKRNGIRAKTLDDGTEVVLFADEAGNEAHLPVPEAIRSGQAFESGMIPHVACAVEMGLNGSADEQALARDYVHWLATRQIENGSHFLDVNVDEISPDINVRNRAMAWIVPVIQEVASIPLSIDSSEASTLEAGLQAHDDAKAGGPAMLNSASLERPAAIELAAKYNSPTIVMSSGESGMPTGADDRVENVARMVELCTKAGMTLSQMYIDPLVLPASAQPEAPAQILDAIARIRQTYGPEIHIAGGHSNVSFGLPMRKLLNAAWIALAVDAGVDAGIIDPITSHPDDIAKIDANSETFKMAKAGFTGEDLYFMNFIEASRDGKLEDPFAKK